ncbi:MAG: hypothetical protein ACOCWQ_04845 [Nanoarchaeota archaeon]
MRGNIQKSDLEISHDVIADIREELDEHLDAINRNTSEVQSGFDYIAEVEAKVDKLSEKLDRVLTLIENGVKTTTQQPIDPLSLREQEVFLALYTEETFLSYTKVAQKIGLPESIVPALLDSIISKGVPILKKYTGQEVCVQIDPDFRNKQAKENVLNINEIVMTSISQSE